MTNFSTRVIGISGGSGSGKTTFARGLRETFESLQGRAGMSGVLAQDSYYIDQSHIFRGDGENVNFDHPDSLDFPLLAMHIGELRQGRSIQVPIYDFPTHQRKSERSAFEPKPLIIVDGTLILSQPKIQELLDWSIFIETSEATRYERRFKRDLVERGRTPEGIRKQFERQVKPMHDLFVEPSKACATEVISGETNFSDQVLRWAKKISGALEC
ncbi:MAG: uridine kinase [Bdellovibrionales bacterium]|nr:uridine kinase [Bdellovibrionales bacterium]